MKCPNCNKEIKDNSKFCSQCGCSVNEEKYIYKETNKKQHLQNYYQTSKWNK